MLEFRDGNLSNLVRDVGGTKHVDSVRLTRLQSLVIEVLNEAREAVMLIRSYFLHYRLIREAINAVAMAGAALLFSYLILQA